LSHLDKNLLSSIDSSLGLNDKLLKAVQISTSENRSLINTFAIGEEVFTEYELRNIFSDSYAFNFENYYDQLNNFHNINDIDKMMILDFKTYLPDDILCKIDRATMAVGLEGREPFLDHKIIEFSAGLPVSFKRGNDLNKKILKNILFKHIPKHIIERPKMGFGVPVEKWMNENAFLKDQLDHFFTKDSLIKAGIQNFSYAKKLLKNYREGSIPFKKVWLIYSYLRWHDKWSH
jgi:asparagine synthase (glutamine-hydrolysing)